MCCRTRAKVWGITATVSGSITGISFVLVRSLTGWRARWQFGFAVCLLVILLVVGYCLLLLLINPYLIRRFAREELNREQELIAREVARTLLKGEIPYFSSQEDLIKQEAIKSIKLTLGVQRRLWKTR
jgi:hypothetical protein